MATELRQTEAAAKGLEKETLAGGEEIFFEPEKGVRVRKSGGVEFAPPLSKSEIEARSSEVMSQIDYQKAVISRAREESIYASKQANEQEILAREALELKEYNRKRQLESAQEAKALAAEVSILVEKEKQLEHDRAAAHRAAVEKEKERVRAKTSEVISREEANEAEKREVYHKELVRKSQALSMKYKLEEEQSKLKLESLQYTLQYGEFRSTAGATKAKIIVEVEPRDIPEARQFDTAQLESSIASAELAEEGIPTVAETRTIEEIVSSERTSKKTASSGSHMAQKGGIKTEESYGYGKTEESETRDEKVSASTHGGAGAAGLVHTPPPPPSTGDIKVLPDMRPPMTAGGDVGMGGYQSLPQGQALPSQPSAPPMASSQLPPYSAEMPSSAQYAPAGGAPPGQSFPAVQQFPQGQGQALPQPGAGGESATAEEKKAKQKSGGFFKKFGKSKQPASHEQH